jgi:hypothetical protein
MKPIKLLIKRGGPFGYNWYKHFEVGRILLEDNSSIQTEGNLAYYIFTKYGPGRYQILAWQGGHEGFWLYWLGDISESGYFRDRNKNKELQKLKAKLNSSTDFEEKQEIEEEIGFTKDIKEIESSGKRRGPIGIKTSRPGEWHSYEPF